MARVADMSAQSGPDTVTIIVNPRAGRGRAIRLLRTVAATLKNGLPDTQVRIIRTRSYLDAQECARRFVEHSPTPSNDQRPNVLVAMGGDGMANLGLNACAGSAVQLAVVPAGTGDDFARGTGVPRRLSAAVAAIIAGHHRRIDAMLATGGAAGGFHRLVGSVVSSGYDAKVNARVNSARVYLGSVSYLAAAVTEIANWLPVHYQVRIDQAEREFDAILMAVGNAGYVGGGIPLCPLADPSDGLLDITIVHPMPASDLIPLIPRIYNGAFVSHPKVEVLRARQVDLAGRGLIPMADGEALTAAPLHLACQPGLVDLIVAAEHADG